VNVAASTVQAVADFLDGAVRVGWVTVEQARQLTRAGWLPYIAWRKGSTCGCTTGEALRNEEVEAGERRLRARGICPRCRVLTPGYAGGGLRHKPDCPSWGK